MTRRFFTRSRFGQAGASWGSGLGAAIVAVMAGHASGLPVTLTVDQTLSDAVGEICVTPPIIGQRCDSFVTPIAGTIEIDLDSAAPTQISIADFNLAFVDDIQLNYSWGFLGSLSLSLSDASAVYATPGMPAGPSAIDVGGGFLIEPVLTLLQGSGQGSGSFLGTPVNQAINLADQGPLPGAFGGTVSVVGDTVSLVVDLPFATQIVDPTATVDVSGTITLVATGTLPPACPADLTGDGQVDSGDLAAFIDAFLTLDPAADLTGDGQIDSGDLAEFIALFIAGC